MNKVFELWQNSLNAITRNNVWSNNISWLSKSSTILQSDGTTAFVAVRYDQYQSISVSPAVQIGRIFRLFYPRRSLHESQRSYFALDARGNFSRLQQSAHDNEELTVDANYKTIVIRNQ